MPAPPHQPDSHDRSGFRPTGGVRGSSSTPPTTACNTSLSNGLLARRRDASAPPTSQWTSRQPSSRTASPAPTTGATPGRIAQHSILRSPARRAGKGNHLPRIRLLLSSALRRMAQSLPQPSTATRAMVRRASACFDSRTTRRAGSRSASSRARIRPTPTSIRCRPDCCGWSAISHLLAVWHHSPSPRRSTLRPIHRPPRSAAHPAPPPWRRSWMACDRTIGRGVKPLRIAHHGDRHIRVGDGRRAAGVVDHVQDATEPGLGEEDREQIVEA